MSEHHVIVIPEDIGIVPDDAAVARAIAVLASIPGLRGVEAIHRAHVEYVYSGENHEVPVCPRCAREIYGEWVDAMNAAFDEKGFFDRALGSTWSTRCCGALVGFHDVMRNDGLARFELRAANGAGTLRPEHVDSLAQALGFPFRVIYRWM